MSKITKIFIGILAVIMLFVLFNIYVAFGITVAEEHDYYNSQLVVSVEQIQQVLDEDSYWKDPSNDERSITLHLCHLVEDKVHFTYKNDIQQWQGNCEGQAVLCSAILNAAYQQRGLENCYAKPVISQIYLYHTNLNELLYSIVPEKYKHFVVNHCVNKVHYSSGEEEYFDTTVLVRWLFPVERY